MKKYIFLVDDDPDDLLFIKSAFDKYKHFLTVKTFSNGMEVLEGRELSPVLPSLILMDLNMPVMSGFDSLKFIKKSKIYNDIPVIILSTSNSPKERLECLQCGASDYICKPFSIDEYDLIAKNLFMSYIDVKLNKSTSLRVQNSTRTRVF